MIRKASFGPLREHSARTRWVLWFLSALLEGSLQVTLMHLCILATLFSALSAASSLCWHDKDYRCRLNRVIPLYIRCIIELKQTCVHIRNAHTNNIHFWVNWYKFSSGLISFCQLLMPWWMCVCVVTYFITLLCRNCVRACVVLLNNSQGRKDDLKSSFTSISHSVSSSLSQPSIIDENRGPHGITQTEQIPWA